MTMRKFSWECPFCGHDAIVHSGDHGTISEFTHIFHHGNGRGAQLIDGQIIVCPNDDCRQYTLALSLSDCQLNVYDEPHNLVQRQIWSLIPESRTKVFPDYIPKPILDDYREACLIRDKSPRASATLSRRCLQGMIRDFWNVTKRRLVDEIDGIKDKVDADTWEAIDAVRQIGNIGAHMEADINLIVDVEPNEAQSLIELIETLLTEWYIGRHERQQRMAAIKGTAVAKKALKQSAIGSTTNVAPTPTAKI